MTTEGRFNFTKAAIEALPSPPAGKRKMYHDEGGRSSVKGLCLEVTGTGRRTFYVYKWGSGKPQKVRIGAFPDWTIEQARKRAAEEVAAISRGEDPSAARSKKRGEWTFGELFTWYIDTHAKPHKKERSWREDEKNYRRYLEHLADRKLSAISRGDIRQLHAGIRSGTVGAHDEKKRGKGEGSGLYAANRALALVRSVFNRAIAEEIFPGPNPAQHVKMFREQSRERNLSPQEAARFFEQLELEENKDVRDFILLLLLTGARKSNVLAMRWEDVDFQKGVWRIPMTKGGRSQLVPLEASEIDELLLERWETSSGSPWVFPAAKSASGHMVNAEKPWRALLKRARIEDFRLHDLRRTLGSWMADTGTGENVIGKALGHVSPAATKIYARLSMDPIREAKRRAHEALRGGS